MFDEVTTTGMYEVIVQENDVHITRLAVMALSNDEAWGLVRSYYCDTVGKPDVWQRATINVIPAPSQVNPSVWVMGSTV